MAAKKMVSLMTPMEKVKKEETKIGMDFSYFQDNKVTLPTHDDATVTDPKDLKKTTARKRKSTTNINTENTNCDTELDMTQSNEPYSKKYEETTGLLKGAIAQLDSGLNDIQRDVNEIRSSRTLKRKYDYLSMLQGSMGQFINTKVSALREMNNTITKCNELELRRIKDLRLSEDKKDDDKAIMDMYNAFISTPTSSGLQMLGPGLQDISTAASSIQPANLGGNTSGYQQYINTMNPSQVLMMYEDDPDVQQVVMYDESNGAKWFEIMNTRTGEIIKGADKHDQMFLEDTDLDLNNNIARNINLGETYPLIRVGQSILDTY